MALVFLASKELKPKELKLKELKLLEFFAERRIIYGDKNRNSSRKEKYGI